MSLEQESPFFQISIFGESQSGKSSLSAALAGIEFSDSYIYTVGGDRRAATARADNQEVRLGIWDTSRRIDAYGKRGIHTALICVDLTDPEALTKAKTELDKYRDELIPGPLSPINFILVGTKSNASARTITQGALEDFAHSENVSCMAVSAKTMENIDQLKVLIAREALANYRPVAGEGMRAAASSSASSQRKPGIFNYLMSKITSKKETTSAANPSDKSKRRPRPGPR